MPVITNLNTGQELKRMNKNDSKKLSKESWIVTSKCFITKNSKVLKLLYFMVMLIASVQLYLMTDGAMYSSDADLLKTYKMFGGWFMKLTKVLGVANIGTLSLNTWTVYSKTKDYSNNASIAYMAAIGYALTMSTAFTAVPDIFSKSIEWDRMEAEAITSMSLFTPQGALRMISQVYTGEHIVPSSRATAEQIRKTMLLPMYSCILAMIKTNLVAVTFEGHKLLQSLGYLCLEPQQRIGLSPNSKRMLTNKN
jgi:hypothetical protein